MPETDGWTKFEVTGHVIVECVSCKATRRIGPDDPLPAGVPICAECGMPMVPIKAEARHA